MPKIPFFIPSITKQYINAVKNTLKKKWISQGKLAIDLRKNLLKNYEPNQINVLVLQMVFQHCILQVLVQIKKNDEVLIPSVNFVASQIFFQTLKQKYFY